TSPPLPPPHHRRRQLPHETSPSQRRNQDQQLLKRVRGAGTSTWPPAVTTNWPLTPGKVNRGRKQAWFTRSWAGLAPYGAQSSTLTPRSRSRESCQSRVLVDRVGRRTSTTSLG